MMAHIRYIKVSSQSTMVHSIKTRWVSKVLGLQKIILKLILDGPYMIVI